MRYPSNLPSAGCLAEFGATPIGKVMKLHFEIDGVSYEADSAAGQDIAIPLQFDGPQANHFGAARARSEPLRLGSFVGKTELGGSCNVDSLALVPHCNGTHTETVSHIVHDDVWIGHSAMDVCCPALLISVPTIAATMTGESYRPALLAEDHVVTAEAIRQALTRAKTDQYQALIIRTLPNAVDKRSMVYSPDHAPAFLTVDAMQVIRDAKFRHLLVDLPSVDRMYDEGLLTNHHLFWNVPEGRHALTADSFQEKTITEMIFVEDHISDGQYLLNLQIPSFSGDAAPSRPIILPIVSRSAPDA